MKRIRVASLQYYIRPVTSESQFQDQVSALVETAADYGCQIVLFPEYFTVQLLTLGDVRAPIRGQIRNLATHVGGFIEFMRELAIRHKIYLLAGTIPVVDPETGELHNEAHFFSPEGKLGTQGKLHMTRFESEDWVVQPRAAAQGLLHRVRQGRDHDLLRRRVPGDRADGGVGGRPHPARAELHRRPPGLSARALLRARAGDREPDVRHRARTPSGRCRWCRRSR